MTCPHQRSHISNYQPFEVQFKADITNVKAVVITMYILWYLNFLQLPTVICISIITIGYNSNTLCSIRSFYSTELFNIDYQKTLLSICVRMITVSERIFHVIQYRLFHYGIHIRPPHQTFYYYMEQPDQSNSYHYIYKEKYKSNVSAFAYICTVLVLFIVFKINLSTWMPIFALYPIGWQSQ